MTSPAIPAAPAAPHPLFAPPGIAIVAPSGYGPDNAGIVRAVARLEAVGCEVHNYFDSARVFQRFGASDDERLAMLEAAAANPRVQVVMALRGQYGLTRLLPRIDFARMAASGKLFVGFSDFTAFQLGLLAERGAISFAGPMLYSDFAPEQLDDFTVQDFWQCLAGPTHTVRGSASANPDLNVEGTLWGGNLAMVMSLVGTPYLPKVEGGILFLEDVNEHPYRVERMLLQLHQAGVLAKQRAVLLGDFSGYRLGPGDNGYDFDAMLAYLRATLPVPVLTGLQFGHGRTRVTLPCGAPARLVSEGGAFALTARDYPTLPSLPGEG
ncbi:MAG: muramoyltetrapeptide carboxypeptidase [Gammaproteobacteria bacterium]